jgi:hypothetical protein
MAKIRICSIEPNKRLHRINFTVTFLALRGKKSPAKFPGEPGVSFIRITMKYFNGEEVKLYDQVESLEGGIWILATVVFILETN